MRGESTTTDETPNLNLSLSSGFPMHYIWVIVGIAFAILIAIIILVLIAIVYLNHKKNKIRGTAACKSMHLIGHSLNFTQHACADKGIVCISLAIELIALYWV